MAEQWPSVGRIVHVRDFTTGECLMAGVAKVNHSDDPGTAELNLSVSNAATGNVQGAIRVKRGETKGTWHWPQYVGSDAGPDPADGCLFGE